MRLPATLALIALAAPAQAHFGMIIPSDSMVDGKDGRSVALEVSFSHPFEGNGMDLAAPAAFAVTADGTTTDLEGALLPATIMGHAGFTLEHPLERPGTHVFHMTPEPYWEPAEDVFIVHHTKTYVAAFGDDTGWDAELGLPTEIVPLSKPFGLWAGNVFQGIVKVGGAPAPHAEVEIEHYGMGAPGVAPSELMITQTVKADGNGVFTYAAPVPGWWGFAALSTSDATMPHEGVEKAVELGAVLWVKFEEWGAGDPRRAPLAAALAGAPAGAHQLVVFAWVDGAEVVVEGKFSNGRRPIEGTVQVLDARGQLVRELPLEPDGRARFPVEGAEEGLTVRIETGEGHENSWMLTPADLAGATGN